MDWQQEQELLNETIARFPETFGLRNFPGVTFAISRGESFVNGAGEVMIYLVVKDGERWEAFAKGWEQELRANITPAPAP